MVAYSLFALLCVAGALLMVRTQRCSQDSFIVDAVQSESDIGVESPKGTIRVERAKSRAFFWLAGAALGTTIQLILSRAATSLNPACALLGALAAEVAWQSRTRSQKRRHIRRLEFYLPTVMERVVMAVGAGFDILPALTEAARGSQDPVSNLLQKAAGYMNSGLGLEDSLNAAVSAVECPALKHVCVHLALAHRQGGELVRPLRELGDSTQAYYQETVEEEIAQLPVKAVLPLVLTFAGLILCFLTVPIIQLGSFTSKVSHVAQ